MINGNLIGFGMFVIGAIVAAIGGFVLKLPNAQVMIAVGITLILVDFLFRFLSRKNKGWLWHKEFGGYAIFLPVWILGIAVIVINIVNILIEK